MTPAQRRTVLDTILAVWADSEQTGNQEPGQSTAIERAAEQEVAHVR